MSDEAEKFTAKFRPIEPETLSLLLLVHEAEGDAFDAFNRLMSAFFVSAAIMQITPQQICNCANLMMPVALRAVQERRDIFGGRQNEAH